MIPLIFSKHLTLPLLFALFLQLQNFPYFYDLSRQGCSHPAYLFPPPGFLTAPFSPLGARSCVRTDSTLLHTQPTQRDNLLFLFSVGLNDVRCLYSPESLIFSTSARLPYAPFYVDGVVP